MVTSSYPDWRGSLHPERSESARYAAGNGCENISESNTVGPVQFSSQRQFESTFRVMNCHHSNVPGHDDLVFRVHPTMYSISSLAMCSARVVARNLVQFAWPSQVATQIRFDSRIALSSGSSHARRPSRVIHMNSQMERRPQIPCQSEYTLEKTRSAPHHSLNLSPPTNSQKKRRPATV